MLYINGKLFSRPIIASHKILTLLKGQFIIYKKQAGAPLFSDMGLIQTILKSQEYGCFRNIEICNSPSECYDSTETYLSTILRSFSWFYEFILRKLKAFSHSNMAETTVSVISSHSEEPVAHFNIANLNKSAEEFAICKLSI